MKKKTEILTAAPKLDPQQVLKEAVREEIATIKAEKGKGKGKGKGDGKDKAGGSVNYAETFATWATSQQRPEPVWRERPIVPPPPPKPKRQYSKSELAARKTWPRKNVPNPEGPRGNKHTSQKGGGKSLDKNGKGKGKPGGKAPKGGGKGAGKGKGQQSTSSDRKGGGKAKGKGKGQGARTRK